MLPSQAKPSQAKPSQAKPSQAKPSQAKQDNLYPAFSLEEQARRKGLPEEAVRQRVQQYEARWMLWAERQIRSAVK